MKDCTDVVMYGMVTVRTSVAASLAEDAVLCLCVCLCVGVWVWVCVGGVVAVWWRCGGGVVAVGVVVVGVVGGGGCGGGLCGGGGCGRVCVGTLESDAYLVCVVRMIENTRESVLPRA